jgi:hypothetical protein
VEGVKSENGHECIVAFRLGLLVCSRWRPEVCGGGA